MVAARAWRVGDDLALGVEAVVVGGDSGGVAGEEGRSRNFGGDIAVGVGDEEGMGQGA
jgi:hypothetical protein